MNCSKLIKQTKSEFYLKKTKLRCCGFIHTSRNDASQYCISIVLSIKLFYEFTVETLKKFGHEASGNSILWVLGVGVRVL